MNWNDTNVRACSYYLQQVFPDNELLHYVLKYFSSFLVEQKDGQLMLFLGGQNNSKTTLIKLIRTTFGDQCKVLPNRIESVNELIKCVRADTKVCILQDLEIQEDINYGMIKRLTGGDDFYCDGQCVTTTFKLISCTNNKSMFEGCHDSIKNRIKIIPFLSTFSERAPTTLTEQVKQCHFRADPFFMDNIDSFRDAFRWILEQYLPFYLREGLNMPDIVKNHQL